MLERSENEQKRWMFTTVKPLLIQVSHNKIINHAVRNFGMKYGFCCHGLF